MYQVPGITYSTSSNAAVRVHTVEGVSTKENSLLVPVASGMNCTPYLLELYRKQTQGDRQHFDTTPRTMNWPWCASNFHLSSSSCYCFCFVFIEPMQVHVNFVQKDFLTNETRNASISWKDDKPEKAVPEVANHISDPDVCSTFLAHAKRRAFPAEIISSHCPMGAHQMCNPWNSKWSKCVNILLAEIDSFECDAAPSLVQVEIETNRFFHLRHSKSIAVC